MIDHLSHRSGNGPAALTLVSRGGMNRDPYPVHSLIGNKDQTGPLVGSSQTKPGNNADLAHQVKRAIQESSPLFVRLDDHLRIQGKPDEFVASGRFECAGGCAAQAEQTLPAIEQGWIASNIVHLGELGKKNRPVNRALVVQTV